MVLVHKLVPVSDEKLAKCCVFQFGFSTANGNQYTVNVSHFIYVKLLSCAVVLYCRSFEPGIIVF